MRHIFRKRILGFALGVSFYIVLAFSATSGVKLAFVGAVFSSLAYAEKGIDNIAQYDKSGIKKRLLRKRGRAAQGKKIFSDPNKGNCTACHQLPGKQEEQAAAAMVGPALAGIAQKYNKAQLRLLIVDPRIYFPQTIMPAYYNSVGLHRVEQKYRNKTILTAAEIEHLVAYLATIRK